jgi:3-oxoacid CoA-transferase subunit A/3-oxoadipate CoA-transferase alpha subunit
VVSNNLGEPGRYLGRTLQLGKIRRAVGSFFTSNPEAVRAHAEGRLEVTLLPQGTFAEALRAGGAGLGGFYTPTGVGTLLAEGKEVREIGGRAFLFQEALTADVALVRARRADRLGNLTYSGTARNFNPLMATAARTVIVEVDEVVEVGGLDPEQVVTPHLYVDHLVLARERL